MPKLDLKAAHAARSEVRKGDPVMVTFPNGKEVRLPDEPSIECAEALMLLAALGDEDTSGSSMELMIRLCREMLGETLYEEFLATGPTVHDLMELGGGFSTLYPAADQGESSASADSSSPSSSRSRRTSKGTTGSTSQ